jgi:hypothetical protein
MDPCESWCRRAFVWAALAIFVPFSAASAQTFLQVPLNISNTGHAGVPSIAVGPSGEIDVVWLDSGAILFRRSTNGGQTFQSTMTVATTDLPAAGAATSQPQIAVNSSGVDVAWAGVNSSGGGDIFFSSLVSGASSWTSTPVNVSGGAGIASGSVAPVPHMTTDPSGGVDIVWGQSGAYFARSTNLTTFSVPYRLTTSTMAKLSPRIAINAQGHVFVVWENAAACPTITFARSTNAGTSFTDYSVADNLTVGGQPVTGCTSDVQIATGANNTIWLLWANENPNIQDVIITYATDSDTSFSGSSFPEAYFENLASTASMAPQMAIDSNGDMNVVWIGNYQQNGGPEAVYFSRSTNPQDSASFCGGKDNSSCPSGPRILTNPPASGLPTAFPQIGTESSGAIDVIWQQASAANPSGAYDILLARSTDGQNFSPFKMSSAPTTAANTGQIAADTSGNVYVVWQGSAGSGGDVLINGDSAGITTPPPFSISNVTGSVSPISQTVNVGGAGNFTVTVNSANSVPGSVTLGCAGLPAGVNCAFNPKAVTLNANGSGAASLSISVSAKPTTSATMRSPGGRIEAGVTAETSAAFAWGAGFVIFLMMLIAARHEDWRVARWARAVAWSLVLTAAVTAMVSCGGSTSTGGGGGGNSITFPVTIQGQANSASTNLQSVSITVP